MSKPNENNPDPYTEADQESNRVGTKSAGGKRLVDLIIFGFVALAGISAAVVGVFSYFGGWQNKETWVVWTLYCVVVFTVTAGFLSWQKRIWDSAPKSVPVEKNHPFTLAQQEADRAWVVVKAIQMKHTVNSHEPPTAIIVFTNSGKTPAVKCEMFYILGMHETERRYSDWEKDNARIVPGQSNPVKSQAVLIPGGEYLAETGWYPPKKITDEEMTYIVKNNLRTYVAGIVKYDDVFGRPHETEFCFVNESFDSIRFISCSKYNTVN
jgi:hypothetical protein